jgi:hypothetical protein
LDSPGRTLGKLIFLVPGRRLHRFAIGLHAPPARAEGLLALCEKVDLGDARAAIAISGRLHESLSLTAKLTGELVPHTGVSITNVLLSPDFMRLRAELLRVLARYPEVREEVAAVFRRAGHDDALPAPRRSAYPASSL